MAATVEEILRISCLSKREKRAGLTLFLPGVFSFIEESRRRNGTAGASVSFGFADVLGVGSPGVLALAMSLSAPYGGIHLGAWNIEFPYQR